jgi:hypothetical protein
MGGIVRKTPTEVTHAGASASMELTAFHCALRIGRRDRTRFSILVGRYGQEEQRLSEFAESAESPHVEHQFLLGSGRRSSFEIDQRSDRVPSSGFQSERTAA